MALMHRRIHPDWVADAESRLLDASIELAPSVGWNGALAAKAGKAAGLSEPDVELILPKGAADLAALFSRRHDDLALAELEKIDIAKLKVRERIHTAVETRLDVAMQDEAALKALHKFLTVPTHAPLALRLGWGTADRLWRWAGDTATDENHYTKRIILGGVLLSTLTVRMTRGHEHARKHLSDRIDQVMAFEKWKAAGAPKPSEWGTQAAALLGRMRYGARNPQQEPPAP
jgi:ubiquinone biosynthesis protein COQ9